MCFCSFVGAMYVCMWVLTCVWTHMCVYTSYGGLRLTLLVFLDHSTAYMHWNSIFASSNLTVLACLPNQLAQGISNFFCFHPPLPQDYWWWPNSSSFMRILEILSSVLICKPPTVLAEWSRQLGFCFWSESSLAFYLS